MRYVIFFFFLTVTLQAQSDDDLRSVRKNSIGLTLSTESIGNSNSFNEAPIVGIDYRRSIKDNNELRLSLGYQHSNSSIYESSFRISAGINRFLYKSPKMAIYGATELVYNKFPKIYSTVDSKTFESFSTDQFGLSILLGIEFSPSSRLSLFLEPRLMSLSIFESANGNSEFQTDHLKFLKGSQAGIKYRF